MHLQIFLVNQSWEYKRIIARIKGAETLHNVYVRSHACSSYWLKRQFSRSYCTESYANIFLSCIKKCENVL